MPRLATSRLGALSCPRPSCPPGSRIFPAPRGDTRSPLASVLVTSSYGPDALAPSLRQSFSAVIGRSLEAVASVGGGRGPWRPARLIDSSRAWALLCWLSARVMLDDALRPGALVSRGVIPEDVLARPTSEDGDGSREKWKGHQESVGVVGAYMGARGARGGKAQAGPGSAPEMPSSSRAQRFRDHDDHVERGESQRSLPASGDDHSFLPRPPCPWQIPGVGILSVARRFLATFPCVDTEPSRALRRLPDRTMVDRHDTGSCLGRGMVGSKPTIRQLELRFVRIDSV